MNLKANWRRILGGIGFVLAVAWLAGHKSCQSEMATGAVRFQLGERAAGVRSIRAELHRGDDPEVLGFWERIFDERGSAPIAGPWNLHADPGVYRLEVEVKSAEARGRASRSIDLEDGASITVDVTDAVR
jgi:hypothetical protein